MHGENLKMGNVFRKRVQAVRGIERGKCACGECEDFMRSDGATCGYCGCLPTRHSKKDARYSSDSVGGTSDSVGGTSDSVGGTSNSVGGTSDSVGGTSDSVGGTSGA